MRLMSFMLTWPQILARTKTQTRRLGWEFLCTQPHDSVVLMACRKSQGLKHGEKVQRAYPIRVQDARRERLDAITEEDVIAEGFPQMTPVEFVEMFCESMLCQPRIVVTRICFCEHVPEVHECFVAAIRDTRGS